MKAKLSDIELKELSASVIAVKAALTLLIRDLNYEHVLHILYYISPLLH
jgi:hypothetical protein